MYVVVPTNSYTKNKHDCIDKTLQLEQNRCYPQGWTLDTFGGRLWFLRRKIFQQTIENK